MELSALGLEHQLRSGSVCIWLIKRPEQSNHYLCLYVSEGRAYLSDPLEVGDGVQCDCCVSGTMAAAVAFIQTVWLTIHRQSWAWVLLSVHVSCAIV